MQKRKNLKAGRTGKARVSKKFNIRTGFPRAFLLNR
jgi:hypothetical protein